MSMQSCFLSFVLKLPILLCWMSAGASGIVDLETFRNPSPSRSPSYFWMWNAPLERKVLDAQLGEMAANGLQSVCPHAFPAEFRPNACHSAMRPDYLSCAFMEAFSGTVRRAKELGMNVWLYDEGGWPSGLACGQVTASDTDGRFCVRYLERDTATGAIVCKTAAYGKEWGNFPSLLEPGATERFLELTHEKYAAACGDEFGKTIRFAFTDEPTRPYPQPGKVVWTSDFDEQFRVRKGYDIRPHAVLLLQGTNVTTEAGAIVRVDYEDVMSQLFVERYLRPIGRWCRSHGLKSGGHFEAENLPGDATKYSCGSVLRNLRELDVPGVDAIWRQLFPKAGTSKKSVAPFPRYASSVAHQKGCDDVLSESFCIYGDSLTPEQMKWVVDFQMVRGVTVFVFGYYALSNAGQWMTLFEPHSGPVQPYWEFQKPFFRYVHRMCELLSRGVSSSEIAVVFDTRDFWACGEDRENATSAHFAVAEGLDRRNCDYDFIDDDQISVSIVKDGRMRIGKKEYSTVVMPYSRRLLASARTKLEEFRKSGGRVLGLSELDLAPRTVRLSGKGAEDVRVLKRIDGKSAVYFMVNETEEPKRLSISLDEGAVDVCLANPETGEFEAIDGKGDGFEWEFPSFGSAAFIVGDVAPSVRGGKTRVNKCRNVVGWTAHKTMEVVSGKTDFEMRKIDCPEFIQVQLGDWRPVFGDHFSGRVCYHAKFVCELAGKAMIDLGVVKGAARVRVNGRESGIKFFGPYSFEAGVVKGINDIEVEVANTLANVLSSDETRDRISRDFPPLSSYDCHQRKFDREFNESGLYGPVSVSVFPPVVGARDPTPTGADAFLDAKLHVQFESRMVSEENLPQFIADVKASRAEAVQIALCSVAEDGEERVKKFAWCGKLLKTFEELDYPTAVWTTSLGYGGTQTPAERRRLSGSQRLVAFDGVSHCTANCPLDPKLRDLLADNLKDFINVGAKVVIYDDDWIQTARRHMCCLCPQHLDKIGKRLGRKVTTDEVRNSFTGGPNPVRTAFLDVNGAASMSLARHLRDVADSIDKSVVMGVCSSYTLYDCEGLDVNEFLSVLAGKGHRKLVRVSGATYWRRQYDRRYPGQDLDGIMELVRMQGAWMSGTDTTVLDENDPYPRCVTQVPAWATELYDKAIIADGKIVRNKYILRYDAKRSEPGYFNAHVSSLASDEVLKDIFAGTESYGFRCVMPQHTLRTAELPDEFMDEHKFQTLATHPLSAHFLALNGMPVKHCGDGPAIAFGRFAAYIDEDMMKKGVILDLPGACILEKHGVDTGYAAHGGKRSGFYTHTDSRGHRFAVLPFDGAALDYFMYRPGEHRDILVEAAKYLGAGHFCRIESWHTYQVFGRDPRDNSISILIENLFDEPLDVKVITSGRPKVLKSLRGAFKEFDDGLSLDGPLAPHGYVALKFVCDEN